MKTDPVVDEVHAIRQKLAAQHHNDLGAIVADLRKSERMWGKRVVNLRDQRERALEAKVP
jgi:hypothetical protein